MAARAAAEWRWPYTAVIPSRRSGLGGLEPLAGRHVLQCGDRLGQGVDLAPLQPAAHFLFGGEQALFEQAPLGTAPQGRKTISLLPMFEIGGKQLQALLDVKAVEIVEA